MQSSKVRSFPKGALGGITFNDITISEGAELEEKGTLAVLLGDYKSVDIALMRDGGPQEPTQELDTEVEYNIDTIGTYIVTARGVKQIQFRLIEANDFTIDIVQYSDRWRQNIEDIEWTDKAEGMPLKIIKQNPLTATLRAMRVQSTYNDISQLFVTGDNISAEKTSVQDGYVYIIWRYPEVETTGYIYLGNVLIAEVTNEP